MNAAEMRVWVKRIVDQIPRGDFRQNMFREHAQLNLMNALGRKSTFRGKTVGQVLDASAASAGGPGFVPTYDPMLRAIEWPQRRAA